MQWDRKILMAALILMGVFLVSPTYADMRIVVAKWHPDEEQLSVMGVCDSKDGASVCLANAETGQSLGYASSDSCGVWKIKVKADSIPNRVIAVSGQEMSVIKSVYVDR